MRILSVIFLLFLFTMCEKKTETAKTDSVKNNSAVIDTAKTNVIKENIDTVKAVSQNPDTAKSDTFNFSSKGFLFLYPDDKMIAQMEKEYGEEDLATVADDAGYYQYTSQEFLTKNKIPFKESSARFIKFIKSDGKYTLIDRYSKDQTAWDLLFFDTQNDPEKADAVMLENNWEQYEKYFK